MNSRHRSLAETCMVEEEGRAGFGESWQVLGWPPVALLFWQLCLSLLFCQRGGVKQRGAWFPSKEKRHPHWVMKCGTLNLLNKCSRALGGFEEVEERN